MSRASLCILPFHDANYWQHLQRSIEHYQYVIGLYPLSWYSSLSTLLGFYHQVALNKTDMAYRVYGIQVFFELYIDEHLRSTYLYQTIPFLIELIQKMDVTMKGKSIPILYAQTSASVHLTKIQIVTLIACCFFGLIVEKYANVFSNPNFDSLWLSIGKIVMLEEPIRLIPNTEIEKLKCFFRYFERMRQRYIASQITEHPQHTICKKIMDEGQVSFHRRVVSLNLNTLEKNLLSSTSALYNSTIVSSSSNIEDNSYGLIQMNFSNKCLGGGIMRGGCVEEEIRFCINPECMVSMIFCEAMQENEAMVIVGSERFSNYRGYGTTFEWESDHVDPTPIDPLYNCMKSIIVSIDAIRYHTRSLQYERINILREILKAYVGFSIEEESLVDGLETDRDIHSRLVSYLLPINHQNEWTPLLYIKPNHKEKIENTYYHFNSIATGHWGSGSSNGDCVLKALIQLIAAKYAGRNLFYFTSSPVLIELFQIIEKKKPSLQKLYEACLQYKPDVLQKESIHQYMKSLL